VGGASIKMKLNAVEWMIYQTITTNVPLTKRLDDLEKGLYGNARSGALVNRVNELVDLIWPGGEQLNVKQVEVPAATLVKIALLSDVNSADSKVGDPVPYRVTEDVKVGDYIVIPSGVTGQGEVTAVEKEGRFGKQGRVVIDFKTVTAMDGSRLPIQVGERATTENKALELAAGASIAGAILLGPIGLISGYLVEGKPVQIPAGREFYVEVAQSSRVTGLSLLPRSESE